MTTSTLNGTRPALDADLPQQPPTPAPAAVPAPVRPARREKDGDAKRWKRLRWGVRGTLVVGVATSVAANILHALPNPISQAIAAWPPLALLLTVELISRVPVYRRLLAAVRMLATAVIAVIAGWVSYWHMTAVAARYGEIGASPYLLPLSVDGLIVVASTCLVELSGHIDTIDRNPPAPPVVADEPNAVTPKQPTGAAPTQTTASPIAVEPSAAPAATDDAELAAPEQMADRNAARRNLPPTDTAGMAALPEPTNPTGDIAVDGGHIGSEAAAGPPAEDRSAEGETPTGDGSDLPVDPLGGPADPPLQEDVDHDVVPTQTAAAVAYWLRHDPNMHPDDIAARVGKSSRQVRRYMAPAAPGTRRRVTGKGTKPPTDT